MVRITSNFWKSHPILYDVTEIYFCVYAYLKSVCESDVRPKINKIQRICMLLFALLITITGSIALLPLIIYRVLLDAILRFKHGKKYAGLLGVDILFATQRRCITTCILLIDFFGKYEDLTVQIKHNIVETIYHSGYKLTSTVETFMGFHYYLKGEVTIEDAVCLIPDSYLTKDDLIDYVERSLHSPILNKAQWEVRIGTRPLIQTRQYPIIVRIQHSHGDAMTLLKILQKCFSEGEVLSNDYKEKRDKSLMNNSHSDINNDLMEFEKARLSFNILRKAERIPRFGTAKGPQLAIFYEENEHYVSVIKKVKKRIGDVTFTEVLIAALVGSLCDYFRGMEKGPKSLMTCVTTTTRFTDVFLDGKDSNHRHTNNASAWQALVPLKAEVKRIMDHVKVVHDVCTLSRTSIINELYYWAMQLLTIMPTSISKYFCNNCGLHPNVLVSNMPGLKHQTMCGHKVQDMIIFLEEYQQIEFIFVINTYAERLQLCFLAKRGVLKNDGDARRILKDVVRHLDKLEEETRSLED